MAINDKIQQKLFEKTSDDPVMRELLQKLIKVEMEEPGWFKKTYKKALESIIKEAGEQ